MSLLPCPFCGAVAASKILSVCGSERTIWRVSCWGCGIQTRNHSTKQGAEEWWNTRHVHEGGDDG